MKRAKKTKRYLYIYAIMSLICFLSGCNSSKAVRQLSYQLPNLVDESVETSNGLIIERRYKGKVMYYFEKLFSEDKSLSILSIYCGYGIAPQLVKVRIYSERKKVEHTEWGYSDFREEYVSFRQECITTNNPMVLMLETLDQNGELTKNGYISQWESEEYYKKYIEEKGICVRWSPDEVITKRVNIFESFQAH